jgi:hypothetical protein
MSKLLKIFIWLGAICSIWYACLQGYAWVIESESTEPIWFLIFARVFYLLPKIGCIAALISVYRFENQLTKIYSVSWFFGIISTLIYYKGFPVVKNDWDMVILFQHHIIPFIYFGLMIYLVIKEKSQLTRPSI